MGSPPKKSAARLFVFSFLFLSVCFIFSGQHAIKPRARANPKRTMQVPPKKVPPGCLFVLFCFFLFVLFFRFLFVLCFLFCLFYFFRTTRNKTKGKGKPETNDASPPKKSAATH